MSTDFFSSQQVYLFYERSSVTVRIFSAVRPVRMQKFLDCTVSNIILCSEYIHFNVSIEF